MSWIARIIVLLCFLWVLSFPLFGGSQWGKDAFTDLASHVFPNDKKGGVIILMLAVPVLVAASLSSIFATSRSSRQWVRTVFPSQNFFGLWFLLFPCTIYVVACIRRHLKGGDYSSPEKLGEIGNAFAMMATVVLSWLLVPVSRLGPIGSMLGWETISMTQFHIWSGRLIVGGSCVHGCFHIVRWIEQGEGLAGILIPPVACWKDSSFEPTCQSSETECTCYHHFRNFTGLLAVLGLLVIGVSSRHSVRRKTFERFSLLHGVFTPLTLVAILLHYNRAILYLSGGGLYYLASNFPIWIEKYRQQPVKVVSVERLESQCQTRPCISVTLEVSELAIQRYRPGVYGYLKAPSISKVAHPFSINVVPHRNQIRIIFRTLGMFTQRLESQLISSNPPKLYLHGYYGSGNRLEQVLQHDVVVLVAAGIGITPYLSLLAELATSTNLPESTQHRKIILHWICRDSQLMDYCHREYFEEWLEQRRPNNNHGSNISIELVMHKTSSEWGDQGESVVTRFSEAPSENGISSDLENIWKTVGAPFSPTKFTVGYCVSDNVRYSVTFSAMAWIGLGSIWYCYINFQHKHEVVGRAYTAIVVLVLGLIIAILANVCCNKTTRRHEGAVWNHVAAKEDDDDGVAEDSPNIEMGSFRDQSSRETDVDDDVDMERRALATLHKCLGRPTIPELLGALDGSSSPGLFCCAPPSLMQNIRLAAKQKSADVVVYEESFLI